MTSKIALGTVQFGIDYGVANNAGQIPLQECRQILRLAKSSSIGTLDTAIAYGDSESRLGQLGVEDFKIVTKLPPLPAGCENPYQWAKTLIQDSLSRLKHETIHAVLLHESQDLVGPGGMDLLRCLKDCVSNQMVECFGISIYSPKELELISLDDIRLVQVPYNILDRRIELSGWLERLQSAGVRVHARSTFLQGSLLMTEDLRPKYFDRWRDHWLRWDCWRESTSMSKLEACLALPLLSEKIEQVVVGVDSMEQLKQILAAAKNARLSAPTDLATDDQGLINPSQWCIQ